MKKAKKSKHLDVPAESNRDKHINFMAQESGDQDPRVDEFGNLFQKESRQAGRKLRDEEDDR